MNHVGILCAAYKYTVSHAYDMVFPKPIHKNPTLLKLQLIQHTHHLTIPAISPHCPRRRRTWHRTSSSRHCPKPTTAPQNHSISRHPTISQPPNSPHRSIYPAFHPLRLLSQDLQRYTSAPANRVRQPHFVCNYRLDTLSQASDRHLTAIS
jgi:hypothetical protein